MEHPHLIIVDALQHLWRYALQLLRYHIPLSQHQQLDKEVGVALSEIVDFFQELASKRCC
ncbi:hypothetical protein D3C81_1912720 [compost metagenome]